MWHLAPCRPGSPKPYAARLDRALTNYQQTFLLLPKGVWEVQRNASPDIPLADLVIEAARHDDAVLRVECGDLQAATPCSSPQA